MEYLSLEAGHLHLRWRWDLDPQRTSSNSLAWAEEVASAPLRHPLGRLWFRLGLDSLH
jgi:hypothetical protein